MVASNETKTTAAEKECKSIGFGDWFVCRVRSRGVKDDLKESLRSTWHWTG